MFWSLFDSKRAFVFAVILLCTTSHGLRPKAARASDIRVEIRPLGLTAKAAEKMTQTILKEPAVQAKLKGARYRVIQSEFGKTTVLHVYDYTHHRMLTIQGPVGRSTSVQIKQDLGYAQSPSPGELQAAIAVLKKDPHFGPGISSKQLEAVQAMPGVIRTTTGRAPADRIITVDLVPEGSHSSFRHEIVGVNLSNGQVIRYPHGAPPTTYAVRDLCGAYPSGQATTAQGEPGSAEITVREGSTILWQMTVTRPSASSGAWGSGVELTDVYYKGKRVLSRAGVPIFNVKYENNVCGPYRDWSWQEHPYWAHGDFITDGILQANSKPRTIFGTDDDTGNFRGVSIYTVNGVTYLESEMEAGWYRYLSRWEFYPDGTIKPRWGFSDVQNSCTCYLHRHHVYWRLDFDIGPTVNNVVEYYDGSQWHPVQTEEKEYRDTNHQMWRVTDPKTGSGYVVIPGPKDGTAQGDDYGQGDVWVVRSEPNELNDYYNYLGTLANIDAFVNGQDTYDRDIVVWYASHFTHDVSQDANQENIIGPTLKPINW